MDKLSEQVVCKIVGECTLADIGRVRDALLAVHGDSADNMKLWDVWKAGLKRLEILEKPVKADASATVPVEKYQPTGTRRNTVTDNPLAEAVITMWADGEQFTWKDVIALVGETPAWKWKIARDHIRKRGYTIATSHRNRYAKWTIKKGTYHV